MIQGAHLAELLPHDGAMVLLDAVVSWDAASIHCCSRSHLAPDNPLRRNGRLASVCGVEYGLQAAALHGAMLAGGVAQRAGYVARLRDVVLHIDRLDDPSIGTIGVEARLERKEAGGLMFQLSLFDAGRRMLVEARAIIALPA